MSEASGASADRDPLNPRPDVHDFDACLARSAANVAVAKASADALFAEGDGGALGASADTGAVVSADVNTDHAALHALHALDAAVDALREARANVEFAAVRRRLRAGFGDVAALDGAQLMRALEDAGVPSLVVHVDRQAQLHAGQGGLATWTITRDMSEDALAAAVSEMKEHLPDFLKNA